MRKSYARYSGSRLSEVQEPHPQPPPRKLGGGYDVPHVIRKRYTALYSPKPGGVIDYTIPSVAPPIAFHAARPPLSSETCSNPAERSACAAWFVSWSLAP